MGLARRSSKMKDMSRNTEEDKRISFKEEMFRRAEETRSLMMSRTGLKANNGSENGHVGRTSPTGTEHRSAFKIKIEREGEDGGTNGSANEVGQKNYFKVNIEGVSNEKNGKQFQKKEFENSKSWGKDSCSPSSKSQTGGTGSKLNGFEKNKMQNGHQIITDKTKESTLNTKSAKNPSSSNFEDLASEISSYEPKTKPWASDICGCSDREAEKAQLRELNDRHLLLLSEKQGMINCLLQKIETMTKIREVFIDGDREILKNKIDFLQDKLKDLEKQKEEDKKIEIEKDRLIDDLQNKINDLESELENR